MRAVIVALVAVSAAAIAPARADDAPAPAQADSTAGDAQVVCRIERLTGSRIPTRRVCKTQAEWNKMDDEQTSGAMTDNPGVMVRPGHGMSGEGAPRTPGN
jgi:invasion protein IalB